MKQFIALSWEKSIPELVLYNISTGAMEKVPIEKKLKMEIHKQKYCKGYYDLISRCYKPCPRFPVILEEKYTQCKHCENLSGFSQCLGCDGSKCYVSNKTALLFCENTHYVYLAFFEGGVIKVGTAVDYRKEERLLEQGAQYAMFIAKTPNGKIARRIEAKIANLGITSRVSANYKARNLVILSKEDDIKKQMMETYVNVKKKIGLDYEKFFIKPIINNTLYLFEDIRVYLAEEYEQLTLFGTKKKIVYEEYEYISKTKDMKGEILGAVGPFLIMRCNQKVTIINTKVLGGSLVKVF